MEQKMKLTKSHSLRMAFKSCPRKIYFRYVAGIQPRGMYGRARFVGQQFHKGLESLRKGITIEEVQSSIESDVNWNFFPVKEIKIETIKLSAYLDGYLTIFDDDFLDITKIETEVKLEHEDEICIIDAMIMHDDGTFDIIEDKTASIMQPYLEESLSFNEQLLNYWDLCNKKDLAFRSIKYRETQKSLHKLNKNESLQDFEIRMHDLYYNEPERYKEINVKLNPKELISFVDEKHRLDDHIDNLIETKIGCEYYAWPKNTSACLGKFGPCDFLAICSSAQNCIAELFEPNGKTPIDSCSFIEQYQLDTNVLNNSLEI
jgi:hypothetical protein